MALNKWHEVSRDLNTYMRPYLDSDEFFQWWYWDMFMDDGTTIMVAWLPCTLGHIKGVSLDPLSPEIWIDVHLPDDTTGASLLHSIKKAYPLSDFETATKGLKAGMGDNSIVDNNGVHSLKVKEGDIELDLTLEAQLPPWVALPGQELGDPGNPAFGAGLAPPDAPKFAYVEWIPRGKASGTVTIQGKSRKVSGLGYHEQGSSNKYLGRFFSFWMWTKVYLDDYTLVQARGRTVKDMGSMLTQMMLLVKGDQKLVENMQLGPGRQKMTETSQTIVKETGEEIPDAFDFEYISKEIEVRGSFTAREPLDTTVFSYPNLETPRHPSYSNFITDYTLEVTIDGKTDKKSGIGIYEFMIAGGR